MSESRGFAEFYWTIQWRIALRMREGLTFDTAVGELHADRDYVKEIMDNIFTRYKNTPRGGTGDGRKGGSGKDGGNQRSDDGDRDGGGNRGGRNRNRDRDGGGNRGKGDKRRSRSRSRRGPPGQRETRKRSKTPGGRAICRSYNSNKCTRAGLGEATNARRGNCKYRHVCSVLNCTKDNCYADKHAAR